MATDKEPNRHTLFPAFAPSPRGLPDPLRGWHTGIKEPQYTGNYAGGSYVVPPNSLLRARQSLSGRLSGQGGQNAQPLDRFTTPLMGGQAQQTQNPYQIIPTPRNQELADRIQELMGGQKAQQQKADTALNRYESALNRGGVKGYATQETDYLSNIYGGGLKSELAGLRDERATALRGAGDLAHQGLRRDLKLAGFRSRGGAGSRLDRMAADRSQQIEVGIANRLADQSRTDADYLNRLQMSSLGRRQGLMDSLAARELMPLQARGQIEGQQLNRLGQLGQLDRSNQIYHLAETPDYTQSREYQEALEAQGMQPYPLPGGGYANYDRNQTDAFARFPKQPFTGYGVNPLNGLYGYQYSSPLYNNYPRILGQV